MQRSVKHPMTQVVPFSQRLWTIASKCPQTFAAKIVFVGLALFLTSWVRWVLAPVLRDELQFFLYLPAILVAAALFGLRTGFATLVGSLFLTVALWMPQFSWHDVDPTEALTLAGWFSISGLLVIAIALLQRSTIAQRKLIATLHNASQQLEEKSARLEASEKKLAAHAADLERVVAERTARLEETVAELESYSYTIVHDLRSPLRAMQGFAHLLLVDYANKLDVRGADYLRRIEGSAQRLDVLIQGLLSYSDIGQAKMDLQPLDLEAVVDHVINHYPSIHEARAGIKIIPPLGRVIAHESFLIQALSNLLENAIKFVAPETPPQITIRAETRGTLIRLHVVDRGLGLAAAELANIFKPFHRGHEAAGYKGTGMGLAVVKRAIERQGGTVGAFSEPNQGSDFWIELPRAPEEPPLLT